MSAGRRLLGGRGETAAAHFLCRRGYRILAQNFRCPFGEIDLIARDGEVVVFVEVKTRRGGRAGSGAEAISTDKRRRLTRLAHYYLAAHSLEHAPCRFDVISLDVRPGSAAIRLLRNAF